MITRRAFTGGALTLLAANKAAAAAPAFPSREITIIIPWNAGGSNDILARELQSLLAERGARLIVENHPGATGTIGMRQVATASPDGYTLGMGTTSTLAYMAQGRTPLRSDQFTHIARVSTDPELLLVPENAPYKTIEEFLEHMKKNPGKVSIATPGNYNVNHICASMAARLAGVDYINAVYTGGSKVIGDLAGGHVEAAVLKPSESLGQIRAHLVRPIGVFADDRLSVLPEVPTFKERGFDVFPFGRVVQMAYVVGPANLPQDIKAKLIELFRTAITDPRFKEFGDKNAFLVDDLTGDALTAEVAKVEQSIKVISEKVFKQ